MPIYEYRCAQCARVTEVLVKVGARGPRKCEHCSGKLNKIVSRSAFHLKGGGWFSEGYTADSSSEPKKPAAGEAAKSAAKKKTKETKSAAS